MFNKLVKAACTMFVLSTVYIFGKTMACVEIAASEEPTDDLTNWNADAGTGYAIKALHGQKKIENYLKSCFKF